VTTGVVVAVTVVLAAAFVGVWLLRPDLRRRIERPKHEFEERVRRYDRGLHD